MRRLIANWVVTVALSAFSVAHGQSYAVLHQFAGGSSDGAHPYGSLTLCGSSLYGMTYQGGSTNLGTLFQMGCVGSDFSVLHTFAGGSGDGANPQGSLTLSGSTLYGTTSIGGTGGSNGNGTIFKIATNGSDFSLLHSFGVGGGGSYPCDSLTLSGSTLYGLAHSGGTGGVGTLFKMATDGSDFSYLHYFSGYSGGNPYGSLTLSGSTLYGMTFNGGSANRGVVFSLSVPEPSTFALLGIGAISLLVCLASAQADSTTRNQISERKRGILRVAPFSFAAPPWSHPLQPV